MADNTAPTDEEIAAAREVMRRAAAAQAAAKVARYQTVIDAVTSPEFAAVSDKLNAVPNELAYDPEINPHIMSARAGMAGLKRVADAIAATAVAPVA